MRQLIDFIIPDGYIPAAHVSRCRSCNAEIVWCTTPRGRRAPVNPDSTSHFSDCPQSESWRRPKPPRAAVVESPDVARFRQAAGKRFGLDAVAIDAIVATATGETISAPEPERALVRRLADWWRTQEAAESAKDDDAEAGS